MSKLIIAALALVDDDRDADPVAAFGCVTGGTTDLAGEAAAI